MYPQKARPWFLSEWIRGTGHHSWPSQEKSQDSKGENTAVWSFLFPPQVNLICRLLKELPTGPVLNLKKKKILTLLKNKEDFIQDYCDRCQDYCNKGERWHSTWNTWARFYSAHNMNLPGLSVPFSPHHACHPCISLLLTTLQCLHGSAGRAWVWRLLLLHLLLCSSTRTHPSTKVAT